MTVRAFLAFEIPDSIVRSLRALIHDLQGYGGTAVRWTDTGAFHVTMRFFGEIREDLLLGPIADAIASVTAGAKPVALTCEGVGVFPNWKYPHIIWAGFSGETTPLLDLHEGLNHALADFPLPQDDRAFRLHLTLGRAKGLKGKSPLVKRVESLGPVTFGEVTVDTLVLLRSELTKGGAVYTPLKTFHLG
ncbi:MAG: RNA 2',3'-cyclic phosphodiesterase [Deltaproteobacteria bacterium]|nr:RNA 2',3'-cyclic phosphodiesterase [Deltaproteobacteria bacterium]